MNDKFPLIVIVRCQTCSILMLSIISALHHVPLFMDRIWLLLVPVDTEVDLQLLQTMCVQWFNLQRTGLGVPRAHYILHCVW